MTLATRDQVEHLVARSEFESAEELAGYVARNSGMPIKTLASRTGLETSEVQYLLTNRQFRERVTELMTYNELSPHRERAILRRMIDVATSEASDFKDFQQAATWVYRQGGMLRGEKAQVDSETTIRVALVMDRPEEMPEAGDVGYTPPDPFAGVVGLPSGQDEPVDVEYVPRSTGVGTQSEGAPRQASTDQVDEGDDRG